MRFVLTIVLTLFIFATNQAAVAFEQCTDAACATVSIDVQKQAEHQKQDPCCPVHCTMGGHHAVAMPESPAALPMTVEASSLRWGATLMPESATLEGIIEPPSLA